MRLTGTHLAGNILQVWIDGDSCPREVRRVLLRAAERLNSGRPPQLLADGTERQFYLPFHFVSATFQPVDSSLENQWYCHRVGAGPDACDQFILSHCQSADIVITRDIVLAEKLCRQDACLGVLDDRGTEYNRENVSACRRRRDLARERALAALPEIARRARPTGGKQASLGSYGAKELQHFAACFDRCLTRQIQYQKKHRTPNVPLIGPSRLSQLPRCSPNGAGTH